MKVSGQGKLEFESDLSKMPIKKNDDFAKMMLPLQDGHCTFKKVCKTHDILMVLTRSCGIGESLAGGNI